ncbi:MAG TPA: selenocysteine-specific translation elongation factor [Gemmatimonadaceae bacterium]|nr:selenocysteine-specific translation elongation factor [Gemmatimonadaceae bacterium]
MILGTGGHIDHGKTTLVKALTGVDTDRLPEEKRRGITIDLGFAPLRLPGVGTLGVVDVPGHEAFVRTMLAGATGIDLALLVVAADEGVMPQTREHVAILTLLGVRGGVVALTKSDLVEDEWLALVTEDVRTALGASALADAPIVPVSAATGAGLDDLRAAIAAATGRVPARNASDLFRMPIDRAFTVKGTGTVVTGTVWSGSLAADATVRVLPRERAARVRGIQSHGAAVPRALAGTRVAIALAGADREDVERGAWLVDDPRWQPTTVLRADVALLDGAQPLGPRRQVRLHLGTQEVGARVVVRGGALAPGETRGARVVLDAPLLARGGDRFVLRASSPVATIGGGVVVDAQPPTRRARPWAPLLSATDRARTSLDEAGAGGIDRRTLTVRLGVEAGEVLASHGGDGVVATADVLVARAALASARAAVVGAIDRWHAANPLEAGLPLAAARALVRGGGAVMDLLLRDLTDAGEIEIDRAVARRRGWTPALAGENDRVATELLALLTSAGAEPPSVGELEQTLGPAARGVLRFLERRGDIVAVADDRYYAAPALASLMGALREGMREGRPYTPAELRDILGLSRKYLIPFLEYCDRAGVTLREGSGRVRGGT